MRISDWSSDVCSSDLVIGEILKAGMPARRAHHAPTRAYRRRTVRGGRHRDRWRATTDNSGRRSCRHKPAAGGGRARRRSSRSEEHTSELQSLMRISYAVFCLKKKTKKNQINDY